MREFLRYIRAVALRHGFGTKAWKGRFGSFGESSDMMYPVTLSGPEKIYIGDRVTILHHSRLQNYEGRGTEVEGIFIGDGSYLCNYVSILNAGSVRIGKDVLIASHVILTSENHGMDPESEIPYMDQPLTTAPVVVEDGCWIGEQVCIMPGVTIGTKSIIGAGSVVTHSVPPYCVAVGNPAKVIRRYDFQEHKWVAV